MRTTFAIIIVLVAPLTGCVNSEPRTDAPTAPLPPPSSDALRARAKELWDARVAEDWDTVFHLAVAPFQPDAKVEDYRKWSTEKSPLSYTAYEIEQVETQDELGWVKIDYKSVIRKFPDLPPREATTWEKWFVMNGQWIPVHSSMLEDCPSPPSLRDEAEQARLRERYAEAWEARRNADWSRLYEFTDPGEREKLPEETFIAMHDPYRSLDHKIEWIEVVGDAGRVRVSYYQKVNDPSITKMPPYWVSMVESWRRIDGVWYLDIRGGRS